MYVYDTTPEEEINGTATISVSANYGEPYCEDPDDLPWDEIEVGLKETLNVGEDIGISLDADCEGFTAELSVPVYGIQTRTPSCDEYEPDEYETEWGMEDVNDYAHEIEKELKKLGYTDIDIDVSEP